MELLEIEKELAGPDKMSAMEKYDAVLQNLDVRLQSALREGLPPDDFAKCDGLGETILVARKLLRLQVRD